MAGEREEIRGGLAREAGVAYVFKEFIIYPENDARLLTTPKFEQFAN